MPIQFALIFKLFFSRVNLVIVLLVIDNNEKAGTFNMQGQITICKVVVF